MDNDKQFDKNNNIPKPNNNGPNFSNLTEKQPNINYNNLSDNDHPQSGGELQDSIIENKKQGQEKREQRNVSIKTYRDIAVNALKTQPTSLAKMIVQERKKNEYVQKRSIHNPKNMLLVIMSIILILLTIAFIFGVTFYVLDKSDDIQEKKILISPNSLVHYDYRVEYELPSSRNRIINIAKEVRKKSEIPNSKIKIFYFTKINRFNKKVLATANDFFEALDLSGAPDQLYRNLDDSYTTGLIAINNKYNGFLVLRMKDFDTSYSSFLSWEKTMLYDIGEFLGVNKKYFSQPYEDFSWNNKDIRGVIDEEGRLVFGYSFISQNTVILFTNRKSFAALTDRF